jgi:integrase
VKSILVGIPNARVPADADQRRVYSQAEMEAMRKAVIEPAEALLFALLEEVALRNSALGYLRYNTVLTPEHTPRSECRVMEKGRRLRSFVLSLNVQSKVKALSDFLRQKHSDAELAEAYILSKHLTRPSSVGAIRNRVRLLAQRAGITRISVHPHSFRHTLVTRLVNAGNTLDIVSKFMGHTDVQTTAFFYWQPSAAEVAGNLIDPFTAEYHKRQREEGEAQAMLTIANKKLALCRKVIDVMREESDFEMGERIRARLPELEDLLSTIDTPIGVSKSSMCSSEAPAESVSVCASDPFI